MADAALSALHALLVHTSLQEQGRVPASDCVLAFSTQAQAECRFAHARTHAPHAWIPGNADTAVPCPSQCHGLVLPHGAGGKALRPRRLR